jgi:hypothetical protein
LIAFCDGEGDARRGRQIARHLSKCGKCSEQAQRIQAEKKMLSASDGGTAADGGRGLNGVLSAIAAWKDGRTSMAASEMRDRLRQQIQTYFGSPTVRVVDRPGMRAEELLGKANEMLEVFLGTNAAEVVIDDVVRELDWKGMAGERRQ